MINYTAKFSPETYQWLQRSADALNASIDAVLESLVQRHSEHSDLLKPDEASLDLETNGTTSKVGNSSADALPAELAVEVEQLAFLTDSELWQAAENQLDADSHQRMEALLLKQQSIGLDDNELAETESLASRSDRAMLVRAKAAVLLQERGHDISILSPKSSS